RFTERLVVSDGESLLPAQYHVVKIQFNPFGVESEWPQVTIYLWRHLVGLGIDQDHGTFRRVRPNPQSRQNHSMAGQTPDANRNDLRKFDVSQVGAKALLIQKNSLKSGIHQQSYPLIVDLYGDQKTVGLLTISRLQCPGHLESNRTVLKVDLH